MDRIDGPLTEDQDRQVRFVRQAATNLSEMVNDLLDLARIEAGRSVVRPSEFTAVDLFAALRGMFRALAPSDTVAIVLDDPVDLPPLYTDEGKLSQILRNFIGNAVKFTEAGEIRVRATADGDGQVTFAVTDTGIGIAPADQEKIFEEFSQIESALQRKATGAGLGLPLSRKLAELLGGEVAGREHGRCGLDVQRHHPGPVRRAPPVRRRPAGDRGDPACLSRSPRSWWWTTTTRSATT